jgi:DNA-binding SARP family transcriptional activator/tetratricopeptide (TPR) repeat protein
MEFRVLGPLDVVENGRRVPISGAKQRALVAVLCLHANEVVSRDRIIDALWGERPPEEAQGALQYHVSKLRKLLGAERIETSPPGYRLRVSDDELDAARFERLLKVEGADRNRRLREALALWRGPALADFEYTAFAQGEIARLEELRLTALEERIEVDLAQGGHGELVGELEALVQEEPLREGPRRQLMLALYRCGRQAEALGLYKETRRMLVEELGIEPGRELQELERRILNQDPSLDAPAAQDEREPSKPLAPREERKIVTALFCQLVDVTTREESDDPEDVGAFLTPFYVRLRAELERHGGTVEKFVGDEVMAVFGAPVAHEDDPERAVRAALAIRDWIAEQPEDLGVRIGVNSGEALVRVGARPDAGEGMAVGDVVNAAARLQREAPPGTVLVGDATYRATRDVIAYEQPEAAELRGKGKPVVRWLAKEARSPIAVDGARPLAAPFIGRQNDLAVLTQTYARAVGESSPQLVTVVGEPGIGKTRLVAEFKRYVDAQPDGALWRQGRCLSYGDGITFWALGEIVKQHAAILGSDPREDAAAKLATAVAPVTAQKDREWVQSRLAPLVGTAGGGEAAERSEAFAAWRTFFEGIAARQPLVLVIEDLHWADSALLKFVEDLVDWSADVPLLVVCTTRPEVYDRQPAWGGGKRNAATVSLSPLSEDETSSLVAALLAEAALPAETQSQLLERAGGNPLYAEECVRMLRDRGLLAGEIHVAVPETVQAVIAARIDTLAADRKALLHDAAVVGKVFWAGALAAMGRVPKEAVLEGLHELGWKELVRRIRSSSFADDVEYMFWHALVRDVAYAQIPRTERARRHVAAAEWIERRAERASDVAELLAYHYASALELARAAGDAEQGQALDERAIRFLVLAAERAVRLDYAQGSRYYRQALELLPVEDPRRPKILADAADAGVAAGLSFEQIRAELEEAIAALRAQGETVAVARALRHLSFASFARPDSLSFAEEALQLLESQPPGPELALLYARFGQEYAIQGRSKEMTEWGERGLPLLARFGLQDELLETRSRLLTSRCDLGDFAALDELRVLADEALDPARGYGTFAVTRVLNNLGSVEAWHGAGPAAAAEHLRAAVELAGRRGLERPSLWIEANLAEALYELGEWDEVLRIYEETAAWERVGILAKPHAARVLAARGELDAAAALVEELLAEARELERLTLATALAGAAAVEAALGELASAVSRVEEFAQVAPDINAVLGYVAEIGRVCAQAGKLAPLERLLDTASNLDSRLDRFVSTSRAILAEAKGEHDRAETLYTRAEQGWKDHDGVVERAHALVGLGRCRLAAGRAAEAEGPMREARATFDKLGARPLVAEIDRLL